MAVNEIRDWVTVVVAAIAALTGILNLRVLLKGKRDKFVVRLGPVSPSIAQETLMRVINQSDHPITLADWGFIEEDGSFMSIPLAWDTGSLQKREISTWGSSKLAAFSDYFETGYVRRTSPIGAYAKSVSQDRPSLCFAEDAPFWRRMLIKIRLRLQPQYLAW